MREGHKIVLLNLNKPLDERRRGICGPYYCHVPALRDGSKRDAGFGFYFASRGLAMDSNGGSRADLRIYDANDFLGRRWPTGYYTDDFQDSTVKPYVVRLNHGRGFLPAYGEGAGMWGAVEHGHAYPDAEDAAREAHRLAERAAENMREDAERFQAEQEAEDAREDAINAEIDATG